MRVLCDACVLYPTVMREVLMGAASKGFFKPFWSERILEEWARAARKIGPTGEMQARGEIALLRAKWPESSVQPHEGDLARLWLPDPNDIHVLAAAIACSADIILTLNAKDFPRHTLSEEGLERTNPDDLLFQFYCEAPDEVAHVAQKVHAEAERLAGAPQELRKLLKKARLPRLAKALALRGC